MDRLGTSLPVANGMHLGLVIGRGLGDRGRGSLGILGRDPAAVLDPSHMVT